MTHCFTHWCVDQRMLALIGCMWNDCPHWSAPCMPPVVPPHLGPAPAGLLSLVWAVRRRSACTSGRSTHLLPCRAAQPRTRRTTVRRDRASLWARGRPPAAPARRRRANRRATQSRVREAALACIGLWWRTTYVSKSWPAGQMWPFMWPATAWNKYAFS